MRYICNCVTPKRLCYLSSGDIEFCAPDGIIFNDGVEDDEQLSHTGGEYDFEGFSDSFQPSGELFDHRITPTCRQRGHVKSFAYGGLTYQKPEREYYEIDEETRKK